MNCPNNKSRNCCNGCGACGAYVTIQGPEDLWDRKVLRASKVPEVNRDLSGLAGLKEKMAVPDLWDQEVRLVLSDREDRRAFAETSGQKAILAA